MIHFRKLSRASLLAILGLAVLWAVDLIWASWAGLSVLQLGMVLATLAALGANLLLYRYINHAERTHEMILGIAVFMTLGTGFTMLSYLGLTLHMPLADRWLAQADASLGFDWEAWRGFVRSHAQFNQLLLFAYRSMMPQMIVTLFALPLCGMIQRGREFIWSAALSLLLTVTISTLLPAESAWVWHHSPEPIAPGPWHDLVAMRDGQLAILDLGNLRGLVTFPSFHVAMAVLLANAARGTRFALFSLVLNALMIVSTPSEGGHYLVDAIGGVGVAVLAIAGVRYIIGPQSLVAEDTGSPSPA